MPYVVNLLKCENALDQEILGLKETTSGIVRIAGINSAIRLWMPDILWRFNEKYPNITADFWTYTDAPEGMDTYLDRNAHIIYIKKDWNGENNGLNSTYSKTVEALKIINEYLKEKTKEPENNSAPTSAD